MTNMTQAFNDALAPIPQSSLTFSFQQKGSKMESVLKLIAVAAAVRVLALAAIPTSVLAGEYCLTNTSGMRACGFATVQQCLDSVSGMSGTCARVGSERRVGVSAEG